MGQRSKGDGGYGMAWGKQFELGRRLNVAIT